MSTREIAQSICSAVRCDKAGVRSEEIRLHTKPAPIMIMHITAAFHIASRFISPEAPLTTISISLTIFCIQPGARTLNTAPAPQCVIKTMILTAQKRSAVCILSFSNANLICNFSKNPKICPYFVIVALIYFSHSQGKQTKTNPKTEKN